MKTTEFYQYLSDTERSISILPKVVRLRIDSLKKPEYYTRIPFEGKLQYLKNSLVTHQFKTPIVVNRRADNSLAIIDGYQRVQLWKSLGNEFVPAVLLKDSESEEKMLHIALNQMAFDFDIDSMLEFFEEECLNDYGLGTDAEEFDDESYHKKKEERSESVQDEKKDQGIKRMRIAFFEEDYLRAKNTFSEIRKINKFDSDAQAVNWLIEKYNGKD